MKKVRPWNRLLSIVLCLCMVLGMIPGIPLVAEAVSASTPSVISGHYYANGTPLYIVAGTSSGTAIYYLDGSKKVYLNASGASGNDLSGAVVWGGYSEKALDGNAKSP